MSVKELVENLKKDEESYWVEQEKEKKRKEKEKFDKLVEKEVDRLIYSFEQHVIKLESTEEDVARIIHFDYNYYLDTGGKEDVFNAARDMKKYSDWKKSLEEKFDIRISIFRSYIYETIYSNSGYAVGSDSTFQGVRATIVLNE
ncbi:MAG: hypothetical protein DRI84_02840 [Bacteroidetes bacterium]|nr:MAG: hypothetical protein DRI84_02840 [Bacteroidota bacterium]